MNSTSGCCFDILCVSIVGLTATIAVEPKPFHFCLELVYYCLGRDGGNVAAMVVGGSAGVVILFVLVLVIARFQGCIAEEDRDEDLVKEAEEDLDWDDSAMTITVNPMNVSSSLNKITIKTTLAYFAVIGSLRSIILSK